MAFRPFLYSALIENIVPHHLLQPTQPALMAVLSAPKYMAVRLHDTVRPHLDIRFHMFETLLSFYSRDAFFRDPNQGIELTLTEDHNPKYLGNEQVIAPGKKGGAGATIPAEYAPFVPDVIGIDSYDLAAFRQLQKGDFRFTIHGKQFKGRWQLKLIKGAQWIFRRLDPESQQANEPFDLTRSVITGRTIDDLYNYWANGTLNPRPRKVELTPASFGDF